VGVRYLTAGTHPDHDTICTFRRSNFEAVSRMFLEVLKLAHELKLVKVGTISIDGTHIKANASKFQALTYQRACALEQQLKLEIEQRMEQAERADALGADDDQKLPDEIARREVLRKKVAEARRRLEERAAGRARAEQAQYEQKVRDREARPGGRKGPKPIPPDPAPAAAEQTKQTSEPVFGIVKQAMGFRQFLLRGLRKVNGEWELVCLAYNVRRLFVLASG
jgi:septal ring factor EnvC (AmiA/AmiB activator)